MSLGRRALSRSSSEPVCGGRCVSKERESLVILDGLEATFELFSREPHG